MSHHILGPEPGRKLRYGVLAPLTIVAAVLGVAVVARAAGFLALVTTTAVGAVLYMSIANDVRSDYYHSRSTMGGSEAVGLQAGDWTDEQMPRMSRVTGALQLFGAGLATAGLLGLVAFAVLL